MTRHPVAFVDESYLDYPGHPGMYLLAAILVTPGELPAVIDAAARLPARPRITAPGSTGVAI
ncbi:hypothetical protein [Paractinoplanes globisporus]|uniref:DUF3800 domain-containing protein n=1 Tax=Paractinoplanes globisporus TaxID=113565 RepID=A0ABW6WHI9_9ACTN|nr:hypothetical protein [Actinoplanes globisporus]